MSIETNIVGLQIAIEAIKKSIQRSQDDVLLLAVSKGHPAGSIEKAYKAGLDNFGENYLQEAIVKMTSLSHLPLHWHFIGNIQSNKTKAIAENFSWVHTVAAQKIAERLNEQVPPQCPPLNVCIQLNLDAEENKAGISFQEGLALAACIHTLPRLKLRGLMMIPKQQSDDDAQYQSFLRLTRCLNEMNQQLNLTMDTLSMGMSHDFKEAIRAGSTLIRVGTAIFGERKPFGSG